MIRLIKTVQVAVVCDYHGCVKNDVSLAHHELEDGVAELVKKGWRLNSNSQALCPKHKDIAPNKEKKE